MGTDHGVELDACPVCKGIWFDRHELLRYLNRLVQDPDYQNSLKAVKPARWPLTEAGFCPKCNQLLEFKYIGKSALHFQKCVNCGGIWLDRRNLQPLALWSASASAYEMTPLWGHIKNSPFDVRGGSFVAGLLAIFTDNNPIRNFPRTTMALVFVNTIIFFGSLVFKEAAAAFYLIPSELYKAPYTIITSMFMHADIFHLFGNMYCLWVFGDNIEDRLGKVKYLSIYLGTGICATIVYIITATNPNIPTLGASGAVSGVMGAYLALYPGARIDISGIIYFRPIKYSLPAWFYIGILFFGLQILWASLDMPGVAWFAHIGGLVAGFATLLVIRRLNKL
jgi:membrane associated rhomboid family serine protease